MEPDFWKVSGFFFLIFFDSLLHLSDKHLCVCIYTWTCVHTCVCGQWMCACEMYVYTSICVKLHTCLEDVCVCVHVYTHVYEWCTCVCEWWMFVYMGRYVYSYVHVNAGDRCGYVCVHKCLIIYLCEWWMGVYIYMYAWNKWYMSVSHSQIMTVFTSHDCIYISQFLFIVFIQERYLGLMVCRFW